LKNDKYLLFKNYSIDRGLMLDLNRVILGSGLGMVFFSTYNGAPFSGFVRSLGVGDFMYGVLMAFPVMGGLFQVLAAYVLERTGLRKKLFLISGVMQRIVIIPIVLIAYIMPQEYKPFTIGFIMLMLLISAIGGSFNGVTFFSWMASIVPINIRGRFFGQRQLFFTITSLLGGLALGFLLDLIGGSLGYIVVLIIAAIFGLLDVACFIRIGDPPMDIPDRNISLLKVWKEALGHRNFRKYLIFWSVWTFAVNLSAPFFNDYMLNFLNMKFLQITLLASTVYSIATVFSVRRWGNMIDKYGNKPVMQICGLGVVLLPFLWIFVTPATIGMIALINMLSGLFWCGVELTANNMMIGLSPEKNRSFYIGSFSMVTAIMGSIVAYFTGGILMESTHALFDRLNIMLLGYPIRNYHLLFVITSFLRGLAVICLLPAVEEENSSSSGKLVRDTMNSIKRKIMGSLT